MTAVGAGDVVADKYRVERLLGSGGMGYVVAARHLSLDQLVAIKFLSKGALGDDEAAARFRREAKAASRLRSDHVAKVFDVGVHDNEEPFIVMEHLDGADLGAIAKQRGMLAPSEASEYVLQTCEALAEAHALGIIHRDVKLANLFLTRSASGWPLVKVLDFGVSKTIAKAEAQADVTKTAAMLGSPKYMSPEQMNDPRTVDGRTDVWSLGVCLYRLVTGRPPFDGDTIGRLCTSVLTVDPAPVNVVRPDVPPGFAAVVTCCLEKDRDRRFRNVAELAAAIAPWCVDPERAQAAVGRIASVLGVPVPPLGWMPPHRAPLPPESISRQGHAAWSATYGSNPAPARRRPELLLAGAIAAMGIVLGIVAVAIFRAPAAKAASEAPPPVTATTTIDPSPDIAPTTTAAPTTPAVILTVAPTAAAVTTTATTTSTAKDVRRTKTPPSRTNGSGDAKTDPFPSDRK